METSALVMETSAFVLICPRLGRCFAVLGFPTQHLDSRGRFHPEFGRFLARCGPFRTKLGRSWLNLGQSCSILGQVWSIPGQCCAKMSEFGQHLANSGPMRLQVGRCSRIGTTFGRPPGKTQVVKLGPNSVVLCPNLVDSGPTRPMLVKVAPKLFHLDRRLSKE